MPQKSPVQNSQAQDSLDLRKEVRIVLKQSRGCNCEKGPLRIYTRKSSEEGLDQEFNSLDAQREACEAFIASQKAEGWVLLLQHYDDGGISGGTLERPSLKRLLHDVDEGSIDQIVVYKIDRLTRSLADFAKLVDRLDVAETSFVSVTQSFNTATSMGRLTLNVLLSFAQFEREVTAERIRDKIAASKKKGLWMGGNVSMGYDADGRTLKINENEAIKIRTIFNLYLEHQTLMRVKQEVDSLNIRTKERTSQRSGRITGNKPISRGNLHAMLSNPIYAGKIRHKKIIHEGQHEAIIDPETFDQVQTLLQKQSARERGNSNKTKSSPLIRKLFDETGDRLTPSHSKRNGIRHRYYISHRLTMTKVTSKTSKIKDGWRLPAEPLEQAVGKLIALHLRSSKFTAAIIANCSPAKAECRSETANQIASKAMNNIRVIKPLIERVTIQPGAIDIQLDRTNFIKWLGFENNGLSGKSESLLSISAPFQLRKRGVESKLIIGNQEEAIDRDELLIKNIGKAHVWYQKIKRGITIQQIAEKENTSTTMVRQRINLAFIAPDLVRQIVDGKQPTGLTLDYLLRHNIPASWNSQRELFSSL